MNTYEGMFLLDNELVREDWNRAKGVVTGMLEKHGGKVLTARRWDERRLTYPIKRKRRATFLLAYCELDGAAVDALRRDLDLTEPVLRYLLTTAEAVPETEQQLSELEQSADFSVPPPPEDDAYEPEEEAAVEEDEDDAPRGRRRRPRDEDEDESEGDSDDSDADAGDEDEG